MIVILSAAKDLRIFQIHVMVQDGISVCGSHNP